MNNSDCSSATFPGALSCGGFLIPPERPRARKGFALGAIFLYGGIPMNSEKEMARLTDEMIRALNESYYFDKVNPMIVNRDISGFDIVRTKGESK